MPTSAHELNLVGEEVISTISVNNTSIGQVVFNELLTPQVVLRLRIMAGAFQRIDWRKASIHLVALNGSVVTSGYTMGFLEDPEISVPQVSSAVIPFLTALRQTVVRQAWVESESGVQVAMSDKPEMFTQPGTDVRRWSPGRVVVATTGDVGTAPTTFMILLKYNVRLYVPLGIETQPNEVTVLNAFADVNIAAGPILSASPWFDTPLSPGQSALLKSDMLCLEAGAQPNRRLRIASAGTRVTLDTAAGIWVIRFPQVPEGEAWEVAEWTNAAGVIAMQATARNGVYGYSGQSE